FTHFHLRLKIAYACIRDETDDPSDTLRFIPGHAFNPGTLPTVMRKVFDLARTSLQDCGQTTP
ncbi:MAG: hypothetical protein ACE369_21095, partial [Roseovarius sp.]